MAILAAVLVPTVTNKIKDANQSSANSEASSYANSIKTDIIAINSGVASNLDVLVEDNAGTFTGGQLGTKKYKAEDKGNTTFTVAEGGASITVTTTVGGQSVSYTVTNNGVVEKVD